MRAEAVRPGCYQNEGSSQVGGVKVEVSVGWRLWSWCVALESHVSARGRCVCHRFPCELDLTLLLVTKTAVRVTFLFHVHHLPDHNLLWPRILPIWWP